VDDTEENRKRVEDIFGPCEFWHKLFTINLFFKLHNSFYEI
jgi:hypothetical protein